MFCLHRNSSFAYLYTHFGVLVIEPIPIYFIFIAFLFCFVFHLRLLKYTSQTR